MTGYRQALLQAPGHRVDAAHGGLPPADASPWMCVDGSDLGGLYAVRVDRPTYPFRFEARR
jgi:hypothetical protein